MIVIKQFEVISERVLRLRVSEPSRDYYESMEVKNMKIVDECYCGCDTQKVEHTNDNCPLCNNGGISVSKVTVEHLVADDYRKTVEGERYRICMNEACSVVYYNVNNGIKILKDQVNVPIWFKNDANPKFACYCSKVSEEQVIEAVVRHGARTVKEVNALTGAMKNANCRENNPLGVCCHKIIQEAIDKALRMK